MTARCIVEDHPLAHWCRPPSRERIHCILSLTFTDTQGRRYYCTTPGGPLRKMWEGSCCYNEAAHHFTALNAAIDRWAPE